MAADLNAWLTKKPKFSAPTPARQQLTAAPTPKPSGMGSARQSGPESAASTGGWWNPGDLYGEKNGKDWYDTSIGIGLGDDLPRAEYERYLTTQGMAGEDNRGRYAQNQYNRAKTGFEAAVLSNPNLRFRDYLNKYLGDGTLDAKFDALTASQRGVNPASRTSTIRWG